MLKRVFDIVFSILLLLLISPLFCLISALILLTSEGPIFYKSKRLGVKGKLFNCLKFRTMYSDAEQKLQTLLAANPLLRNEWDTYLKLKKDPRITPLGKLLRKYSLDELPQFINVLKGDLSVVGPRPFIYEELHTHLRQKAEKILSIKPGITGLWQTSGRNNLSVQDRLFLDEHYIETHTFFLDMKLILKTIPVMLFSKGAY